MWSMGWDEKNGGNISAILTEDQLSQVELGSIPRFVKLEHVPENMVGASCLNNGIRFRVSSVRDSPKEP